MISHEQPIGQREDWLGALDGVRGLAAIWVVAGHCLMLCGGDFPVIGTPDSAVAVFMMVSGFLMTHHYLKRKSKEPWESPRTWGTFYLRRFFRIAPLYYLLLIPAFVFASNFTAWRVEIDGAFALAKRQFMPVSFTNVFLHYSFLFGLYPKYSMAVVLPDWSIGLEMQFYAAFPFILLLFRRIKPIPAGLLLAGFTIACANLLPVVLRSMHKGYLMTNMNSQLVLQLPMFVVGILLVFARTERARPRYQLLLVVVAIAIGCLSRRTAFFVSVVLVAVMLVPDEAALRSRVYLRPIVLLSQLLASKVATFLADMSYSVYLVHLMILTPLLAWLTHKAWFMNLHFGKKWLVVFPIVLGTSIVIGVVLRSLIERPGIEWGRKLIKRHLAAPIPKPVDTLGKPIGEADAVASTNRAL